jgi:hypothetical protein
MARRQIRARGLLLILGLSGCTPLGSRNVRYIDPDKLPDQWRTKAERTGYLETDRYDAVVGFCRRLADASPYGYYTVFGRSGEGRELPLLVLSKDQAFTPEAARRTGKLVVLVQNCIHPGECAGKDASLELARDILITGTHKDLLSEVILLIMPIFSPDGHERFGPYNRINQNGPKAMGWRVTATNLNLNRDYTKADAVEMQAWLRTWVAWQPDFLFDNHTTNGSDHQYVVLYAATNQHVVAPPIAEWMNATLLPRLLPQLAADGHLTFPYGGPRDRRDPSKGVSGPGSFPPRLSTGYSAICNRPSILVEAHARKTYEQRVRATYEIVRHTLEELNRHPDALRDAISSADQRAVETRGGDGSGGQVVLTEERTSDAERVTYKAIECVVRQSDITGGDFLEYTGWPIDVETRFYNKTRVSRTVSPPVAYLVPPQWTEVIQRLELHGIRFFRLRQAERLDVESYRFEDVSFAPQPYEGRQMPRFKTVPTRETRDFVAGTVIVPLDQPRAKVAVHLLEPEAPDALIVWGLFNAIFERKEYSESYVLEPLAREMIAADRQLKREFEEKLRTDEEFAKDARARLNFFYRRSPYWDERHNRYPVARLKEPLILKRLQFGASR